MKKSLLARSIEKVMPSNIKLKSPTGSGYSDEWTFDLDSGMKYHVIKLMTNLVDRGAIEKITLDNGGSDVAYASQEYIDFLNEAYGRHTANGVFVLELSKFHYRSPAGVYQTQLVTTGSDDLTLKVKVRGKQANDPDNLSMYGEALVSENTMQALPVFMPIKHELTRYVSAAEDHEWTFPSGNKNKKIQTIAFRETDLNITAVEVKRKGKTLQKWTRASLDFDQEYFFGIQKVDGFCFIDFTMHGFGTNGIATNDLEFVLTTDSSGSVKVYVDGYEQVRFPQPVQASA